MTPAGNPGAACSAVSAATESGIERGGHAVGRQVRLVTQGAAQRTDHRGSPVRGHRDGDGLAAADRAGHCVEGLDEHALAAVGAAVLGDQRDRIADPFDEAGQHQTGLVERRVLAGNTDLGRAIGEQRQHRAAHHGRTADARGDQVGHPDGQPESVAWLFPALDVL